MAIKASFMHFFLVLIPEGDSMVGSGKTQPMKRPGAACLATVAVAMGLLGVGVYAQGQFCCTRVAVFQ